MSDSEELNVGDFDPSTYQHVLPEGAHDYDDYDSKYERENPELGFTDAQVEEEVKKLNPEDKKFYEDYRDFLDAYYRQHGRIIKLPDLIKLIMTGRFPEIPSTTKKGAGRTEGKTNDRDQEKGNVSTSRTRRRASKEGTKNSSRNGRKDYRYHRR